MLQADPAPGAAQAGLQPSLEGRSGSHTNSAFRDEIVAANHTSVPVNALEAMAREMLENTTSEDPLETQVARTLLEVARLAQSSAIRREKETLVKVPLMPLEAVVDRFSMLPKEGWLSSFCKAEKARGRRTLVYVRQTGTRDIPDRLESVLKQSGGAGYHPVRLGGSASA